MKADFQGLTLEQQYNIAKFVAAQATERCEYVKSSLTYSHEKAIEDGIISKELSFAEFVKLFPQNKLECIQFINDHLNKKTESSCDDNGPENSCSQASNSDHDISGISDFCEKMLLLPIYCDTAASLAEYM
jgi:hypothetical protein